METLALFTENYEAVAGFTDAVTVSFAENKENLSMAGFGGDMQNYLFVLGGYLALMGGFKLYTKFKLGW